MMLLNVEYMVQIGSYQIRKGISMDIRSMSDNPIDWGRLVFQDEMPKNISINKNDKVIVSIGYDGSLYKGFEGTVVNNRVEFKEIIIQDEMARLETVRVTENFVNAKPQDVIASALFKAGITNLNLSTEAFTTKNYIANNKTVLQVIKEVNSLWGVNNRYFFQDGIFCWGIAKEQVEKYIFEYGKNIISLKENSKSYELETVAVPFIKHSQKIVVNHPLFADKNEFIVEKIRIYTNNNGFLRSTITFKGDK